MANFSSHFDNFPGFPEYVIEKFFFVNEKLPIGLIAVLLQVISVPPIFKVCSLSLVFDIFTLLVLGVDFFYLFY